MADIKKTDPYWIIKPIWDSKGYMQGYEVFRSISSADVAPVRHGRWIECTSSPHWKCSMCGTKASIWFDEFDEICEWLSDYCPNCGAKMDEEDE